MTKRISQTLILMFLLGAGVRGQDMQARPESFVDEEGVWGGGIVAICWVNPEGYAAETAWVEETAIQHIEGIDREVSNVRFIGKDGGRQPWTKCSDSANGIRITIADEWPRSAVGKQWERDANGKKISNTAGQYKQVPTSMWLNFTFGSGFPCAPKEHCIRAIALHELLHALGFLHEQLHPETPKECKDRYAGHQDVIGFKPVKATPYYDRDSHMNYCGNMYREPIRLSAGDKAALRKLYQPQ